MRVLVTGASGYIGKYIVSKLVEEKINVTAMVRSFSSQIPSEARLLVVPETNSKIISKLRFYEYDVVIHCAAISSSISTTANEFHNQLMETNVDLTLSIAEQCARQRVKKFIFISSIKVFGESNIDGKPYTLKAPLCPSDPYALSKLKAEDGIKKVLENAITQYVIVRPPIVYGPGVKGNFKSLLMLASINLPLPFGNTRNSRSMIFVGNLSDFVVKIISHPAAVNDTFLVSDGCDLSTSKLLRLMKKEMNKPNLLVPVPKLCLYVLASLFRKKKLLDRLLSSLQIDISETCTKLEWRPPYTIEQGIRLTIEEYTK